jgi:pimeloyl-ACP methyl ester carboxylesterase
MPRDHLQSLQSFDDVRIAYSDEGDGPAVILLHGLAADGRMFGPLDDLKPVLAAIASSIGELAVDPSVHLASEGARGLASRLKEVGFRVIVPDLRGHGASDKPHDPAAYAHSALARDVIALIDHLKLDAVSVLGYSLGAITAAKLLALGLPAAVKAVILGGIGGEILEGATMELPDSHPAAQLPKPLTMRKYHEFVAQLLAQGDADPSRPGASYIIMAHAMGNDVEALIAVLRGDGAEQVSPAALRTVSIPVLVLNGRSDPANLAADRLAQAVPNARAMTCEGDHLSGPWQPSFQQAVVEFLRDFSPRSRD